MILHTEQNCNNAIDILDEQDNLVATVYGMDEGDIAAREIQIAKNICNGFNEYLDTESIK